MIRTQPSTSLAIASAFVGASVLSGALAPPIAHADTLGDIRSEVNAMRSQTCAPLNYTVALEGEAQAATGNTLPGVPPAGQYNGVIAIYEGNGDPAAAATTEAVNAARNAIWDCQYKDFGVGFLRSEDLELDFVAIALGVPPAAPQPAPEAPKPDPVLVPEPAKVAPTNAVQLSFDRGFATWTANVTSTADIPGNCTYAATNPLLPGVNKSFDIGPKGSASFSVLAPPPLSTYRVVVSCKGPFEGETVEFGRVEQTVP
jgi:hypothetical protein